MTKRKQSFIRLLILTLFLGGGFLHSQKVKANPAFAAPVFCLGPQAFGCALGAALVVGASYIFFYDGSVVVTFDSSEAMEEFVTTMQNPYEDGGSTGFELIDLGKKEEDGFYEPIDFAGKPVFGPRDEGSSWEREDDLDEEAIQRGDTLPADDSLPEKKPE